jgi:amidase/aspartyl-tRNA(Asn)/glutamyl-tRNA(Gln) amidotransferase subunit A
MRPIDEARKRIDPDNPAVSFLPEAGKAFPVEDFAPTGPLAGMAYLAKDLFDVPGWPTTASSRFLDGERGIPDREAELVRVLSAAGAVCVGKTHLNEFAYGLSGENPHYGDCPHPEDESRLSGGSSSGSAYAVARGWVPFALGTDTGGSIRVPAAFCNVWGLRYAPGFLCGGCFPLAPSFDTVGILAESADCLARIHEAILPCAGLGASLELTGLLDPDWCVDPAVAAEYQMAFANRGIAIDPVLSAEFGEWMKQLPAAFSILQSREALAVHGGWLDRYRDLYDPVVFSRIARARDWKPGEVDSADVLRSRFTDWLKGVINGGRSLVLPAVPDVSPPTDSLDDRFRQRLLALTTPASMAGLPVVTEPFRRGSGGFSLGFQYLTGDPEGGIPPILSVLSRR